MKSENGGPAFPVNTEGSEVSGSYEPHPGMTLRDYFAAQAPIGIADANDAFYRKNGRNARQSEMLETLAELRGAYADAMLVERAQ